MLSASSLVDFLMNLLSDPKAKAEFEHDPHGVLARHGLDGVCGQDIQDVRPLLADQEGVHATGAFEHHSGGHDAIREIQYVNEHYQVDHSVTNNQYDISYVDHRDTTNINARGDVNIKDSFNQDSHDTTVKDSFNYDNHGFDNRGATIDHSIVGNHNATDSGNLHQETGIHDAYNVDDSQTQLDASHHDTLIDSSNDNHNHTQVSSVQPEHHEDTHLSSVEPPEHHDAYDAHSAALAVV